MSITNTLRKAGPFTCNGVTVSFPFSFKLFQASEIVVSLTDASGNLSALSLVTNYTVTLNGNQDINPGGTVTTLLVYVAGFTITLTSGVLATQSVVLTNTGGFYPDVLNNEFDRLTILCQQIAEVSSRTLVFPISDTINAPLPPAAQRISKYLAFDVNGAPIISSGTGSDAGLRTDLSAPTGASLITYQVSGAGSASRSLAVKLYETVSLSDFSGTTVAQFNFAMAKLTALGGGVLNIPNGSYSLASAELVTPILIPSNVTIEGNTSLLTVTGTTVIGSIFRSLNQSNVRIRALNVVGNSQAVADATSGAFFNFLQDASGNNCENISVENVRLQNFAAERWISILNSSPSGKSIRGIKLTNISAFSISGNNLGTASIGIGSSVIMIYGNTSQIYDVEITNFYADATFIKCGITIFHQVNGVIINSPHILNAGLGGTSNDVGAYAINCYGAPGELTDITINNSLISVPRSCGIYVRGAKRVAINNPYISGQTDPTNATLPKGAIAMDGSADVTVTGGVLSGNYFDFMAAADTASTNFNNTLRGVKMIGTVAYAVFINPTTGTGSPDGMNIIDCQIDSNAQGIYISNNQALSGRNLKNLTIQGGKIIARAGTAVALNPNGSAVCTTYRIAGVYMAATNHGINADNATGDLTINDVIIEDAGSSLLTYGIIARTFPQIHIDNVLIRGMGAGYATLTDGAGGTINTLRTFNVVNGCSPNSLGMIAPTLTGTAGWFVQNLNPVEAGVAASKYVNTGWRYTTSWLQQRALTGN